MKTNPLTWTRLQKDHLFYLYRYRNGDLTGPTVIVKSGTMVDIEKYHRHKGKPVSMLLRYVDRSGKVWSSWAHVPNNT